MVPETDPICYSKNGRIAHIVLNRPQVINAYNMEMRDELYQALEAVRDDSDVLVAILRGAGERGFCAGADLTEFDTTPSQSMSRIVRWKRDIWGLFLGIKKPLIAALHGYIVGSGVEIACLCDFRIASEDAVFSMPESSLAMVPAAGGTQTLSRVIGHGKALELLIANPKVGAREAKRMGLVNKIVPLGKLIEESDVLAQNLSSRCPESLAAVKSAVSGGIDMSLKQGLRLEDRLAARLMAR